MIRGLGKNEYIYGKGQRSQKRKKMLKLVLLCGAALALLISLFFILQQKASRSFETDFSKAMQSSSYDKAYEIYHKVQELATDTEASAEQRSSYLEIQHKMEAVVSAQIAQSLSGLQNGQSLSDEARLLIVNLRELAAVQIAPYLHRKTEDLLDGKITPETWEQYVQSFSACNNLAIISQGLWEQKDAFYTAIPLFAAARSSEEKIDWQVTWQLWENLSEGKDMTRFVKDYAAFCLKAYQEREYDRLVERAQQMIASERYYSAKLLLQTMFAVFPERSELKEMLELCLTYSPAAVETWQGMVEQVSVRPLVVVPEKAFPNAPEAYYANNSLISLNEFKNILQELYRNDYVLISQRHIIEAWRSASKIVVPVGKKPLLLCFEQWQYSVLNTICGCTEQLLWAEGAGLQARAGTLNGSLDAIPILEDFLSTHPDFSFDGAKALLALNGDENIWGYICDSTQDDNTATVWQRIGQKYQKLSAAEYDSNQTKVGEIFAYLQGRGFEFACAGYSGLDAGSLSYEGLKTEVESWRRVFGPWLQDVSGYVFPNGSHVYNRADLLQLLLEEGFVFFSGVGPKAYSFATADYVHLDRTPLNGYTINNLNWNTARFCDRQKVWDRGMRQTP